MLLLPLVTSLFLAAGPVDGAAALQKLKSLEGTWKSDAKSGASQFASWRALAGASAVLETVSFQDKTKLDVVIVYALEAGELTATVYEGPEVSRLKLTSASETQLQFSAGKVPTLTLSLADARLKSQWTVKDQKRSLEVLREYVDTLK